MGLAALTAVFTRIAPLAIQKHSNVTSTTGESAFWQDFAKKRG